MLKPAPIPKTLRLVLLPLFLIACHRPPGIQAAEVVLAWDRPSTNTDGTALTDLASYKLYQGGASQVYTSTYAVGLVTNYTVTGLREGSTYFFAGTAVNEAGRESAYSEELIWTAPDRTPPVISGLTNATVAAGADGQAAIPNLVSIAVVSDNLSPRIDITVTQFPAVGTQVGIGTTAVTITARDKANNQATRTVQLTVKPGNSAPVCNAGADQTTRIPMVDVTLNATATDDGMPANSPLRVIWSVVFGSGNVSFANPLALGTTASFDAEGIYVLRLTVTDGELTAGDEVTVTVQPRIRAMAPQRVRVLALQ